MDVQLIKGSLIVKPADNCDRQVKQLTGLIQNFSTVKMSLQPAILLVPLEYYFATYSTLRFNNCEYKPPKFRHLLPASIVFQRLWDAKFKTIPTFSKTTFPFF